MRNFNLRNLTLSVLAICFFSLSAFAQSKVIIVQKTQQDDGTFTVVKKEVQAGEEADNYLKTLKETDSDNIDIHVIMDGDTEVEELENDEGEMIFKIRTAKCDKDADLEDVEVIIHDLHNTLAEVKQFKYHHKERSDRPFLGVYLDDEGEGILVTDIVRSSGAEAAGLQSGDRIITINGNNIDEDSELRSELSKHEIGDEVDIVYLRNGERMTTEATLGERKSSRSWERDPCKVFIGVSLGGHGQHDKGIYVSGIIDNTPAEVADMQRGDVILALDGVEVNTFNELLAERNKHQPGDYFTLSVLREGSPMEVNAQFKSCDEPEEEKIEEIIEQKEEEEVPEIEELPEVPELEFDNNLELLEYAVFPNPSFGQVNVKFSGEAVPTIVRVVDVNGKELYKETMNNFNGTYEKELNLRNNTAETVFLQIQQGDKSMTKMLQVLPKA